MQLEPGRDLDELIAEKVMGITKICSEISLHEFLPLNGGHICIMCAGWKLKPYSSSINDAYEVSEKMAELGFYRSLETRVKKTETMPRYSCTFVKIDKDGYGIQKGYAEADKAPLTICLSALNALEIKITNDPETD